ncbi:MAG: hypothetical protein JWQ98_1893 [Chlorobi bacterium]|nr:hypothetical protein [Chlorobiota bacterium]
MGLKEDEQYVKQKNRKAWKWAILILLAVAGWVLIKGAMHH